MVRKEGFPGWHDPRAWCAVILVIAANYAWFPVDSTLHHALLSVLHLHQSASHTLGQASFGLEMFLRLAWDSLLWFGVCLLLCRLPQGFPITGPRPLRFVCLGLLTGLSVMLVVILAIWKLGDASVVLSGQSIFSALRNGLSWLALDALGALGEELVGRAVILVLAERFVRVRGAVVVSGIMFSWMHLSNPGASKIWLIRLFLQGVLLAYAVFRTRSIWWSVGYHTGWNWISAPLFGAAGSGYLDEGHIFDFLPHGTPWITGGAVGPEGSLLAFAAVLAAFGLLLLTKTRRRNLELAN